jgi:hypothetical protein
VLDRIALHQTRLLTPGLGRDGSGVALGSKGVILLPSVDRLVGLLAVYCRSRSLEDVLPSLALHIVRSDVGTREIALECAAESSDRMDGLAEAARLVGGLTFTGTSRHFVRYRDGAAPFGYDASELVSSEAPFVFYDDRSSQAFAIERAIDFRSLLLGLMLRSSHSKEDAGPRLFVAEPGLGPALVHYLVRSEVAGEAYVAEWPPESALDDAPTRRWILRVPDLPARMRPLLRTTPGIRCFHPAGPGVAVEAGFRHPIELRACPVFDPGGLVFLRAGAEPPWIVDRVPPMGELASLARIELRATWEAPALPDPARGVEAEGVHVPLRVVASSKPTRRVTASFLKRSELPLLRRLAYALPRASIERTEIALTAHGAYLRSSAGIEAIPLGAFFVEVRPNLHVPVGHEVVPAVAPDVLARAMGVSPSRVLFVGTDARAVAVDNGAFVPLELVLLEAPPSEEAYGEALASSVAAAPIDLETVPIGLFPLRGIDTPRAGD